MPDICKWTGRADRTDDPARVMRFCPIIPCHRETAKRSRPRHVRHLGERGIAKAQVLHTAESLHHDHIPAKRIGLATCWIHRRAGKEGHGATRVPDDEVRPDFRFESLAAMADAHRAEMGA